jgi:hypothetical protein
LGGERVGLVEVAGGGDLPVEGRRALQLPIPLGPAAAGQMLFGGAQAGVGLIRQRSDPGVGVGGLVEAAGGHGGRGLPPGGRHGHRGGGLDKLGTPAEVLDDDCQLA